VGLGKWILASIGGLIPAPMTKQPKKQTKQPRWQIESGTRGVYVGSTYAERTINWPMFTWSPDPA
jgi:hypothetical protein